MSRRRDTAAAARASDPVRPATRPADGQPTGTRPAGAGADAASLWPAAAALAQRLGHTFASPALLRDALTHATHAHEHPADADYERLEFLGDAVLALLAAELLLDADPTAREGRLSAARAQLVRQEALAAAAEALAVAPAVRLGVGQASTDGVTESILADVYEALVGAVYRDGGYAAARATFAPRLAAALATPAALVDDAKTALQERCHQLGLPPPSYAVLAVRGPGHARTYTCEVRVTGTVYGRGTAPRRRAAEQRCAAEALVHPDLCPPPATGSRP